MRGFIPLLTMSAVALAASSLAAQQIAAPAPVAAPQPPSAAASASLDILNFRERSDRMTVPVLIGAHGPFPFVVDTGAERSVVSRELAGFLKLPLGQPARVFDFTGPADVATVKVPSLSAGALGTSGMEAPQLLMADIGAPGMLGIDALQGQSIVLDFYRKRMVLKRARRHASGDVVISARSRTGQLIVTKAWFNGQPIAVVIDTGSWLSVGNSAMLRLAKRAPRSYGPIVVTAVTGRSFTSDFVTVSDVRVGSVNFNNFGMVFADVPPFGRFGLRDKPALILGMSSLKLFSRVELDFVNREVGFTMAHKGIDVHDTCRTSAACRSIRT